jgi:hypothetical protein
VFSVGGISSFYSHIWYGGDLRGATGITRVLIFFGTKEGVENPVYIEEEGCQARG